MSAPRGAPKLGSSSGLASSKPKSKLQQPDVVTDAEGRRRFHGAFTGGFSAGYFNSVGSEGGRGFEMQSFTSSRTNRAGPVQQDLSRFVDEEDGLVGGRLVALPEYDTFDRASASANASALSSKHFSTSSSISSYRAEGLGDFLGGSVPTELVVASSRSIGKTLMRQMGWREGQGVGPRVAMSSVPGLKTEVGYFQFILYFILNLV